MFGRAAYATNVAQTFMQAGKWQFVAILATLAAPLLMAWIHQDIRIVEGLQDEAAGQDNLVVSSLLNGEQLVPPPPLPPKVFASKDVLEIRPNIDSADRNWAMLDADFRQRLLLLFGIMEQSGYQMALLEGYRTPERQEMLAKSGSRVTNARAYQSYHQFGLAADIAFVRAGRLVISEKDKWAMAGYKLYGVEAERLGLTWGGRWQMADFGHIELRRAGVLHQNTAASWTPDAR